MLFRHSPSTIAQMNGIASHCGKLQSRLYLLNPMAKITRTADANWAKKADKAFHAMGKARPRSEHSNPIADRIRRQPQRLPSSPLIENASAGMYVFASAVVRRGTQRFGEFVNASVSRGGSTAENGKVTSNGAVFTHQIHLAGGHWEASGRCTSR